MSSNLLDVSWETIIKVLIAGFIFYVIYLARDIAVWLFFALVISVLLEPAILFLKKIHIPKILAIVLVYFSIFGIIGLVIYLTAPIFIYELKQFTVLLPDYFEKISPFLNQLGFDVSQSFQSTTASLAENLQQSSKGVINALMAFLGGVSSAFFILTMSFFLSLEERGVEKVLLLLFPKKYEDYIKTVFERAQNKVSGWFGARLIACAFVGISAFIVFYIFGIKYAFILALLAGLLNFVPYIGPWITSALLILFIIVSTSSWLTVLYVVLAFMAIQAVENNLLTPILMKRMIDLPPVLVLISLLVGSQIFGFLGTIFAVPVSGIIFEFLKEFLEKKREEESQIA